jgi:hypothetical protein
MPRHVSGFLLVALAITVVGEVSIQGAELQPKTVAAFDRYVRLTESRLTREPYLWVDGLPEPGRAKTLNLVRTGQLSIERLLTRDGEREIEVPDGLIHHWVGTAFIPGATIEQALLLLQNYDQHQRIYTPAVDRSRLISRDGDRFQLFLRFKMKKFITVVVNGEHEAVFRRVGSDRAEGWIHSTRIAEVEHPGEAGERELPVGRDGGYLWRLNTYWRLLPRDKGLYIQCESVSLTRGLPWGLLGLIVRPFVTSIPSESLTFTLETTRKELVRGTH